MDTLKVGVATYGVPQLPGLCALLSDLAACCAGGASDAFRFVSVNGGLRLLDALEWFENGEVATDELGKRETRDAASGG